MARLVVAVTGGKGGTGKSFVATNLAALLSAEGLNIVLADLDVEAPNDHLLLGVEKLLNEEPVTAFFPFIDYSKCTACGACAKACDTGAIIMAKGKPPMVMPRLCSGCKACLMVCPYDAIAPDGARIIGYTYLTPVKLGETGFTLLTGVIREGEEHTPPAVVKAKRRAYEAARNADVLIIDTGAGTGNSISVAIQEAQLVLAVTEPTPMGLHDLRGILEIARGMGKRVWMVVNRAGLGDTGGHLGLAEKYSVERVMEIPYSENAAKAYASGVPVVLAYPDDPASRGLRRIAGLVRELLTRQATA